MYIDYAQSSINFKSTFMYALVSKQINIYDQINYLISDKKLNMNLKQLFQHN